MKFRFVVRDFENKEFYDACQAYRHLPMGNQVLVNAAYQELKRIIQHQANALLEAEEAKCQRIYWLQENTPAGILAHGHKSDRSTRHTHTALLWNVEGLK